MTFESSRGIVGVADGLAMIATTSKSMDDESEMLPPEDGSTIVEDNWVALSPKAFYGPLALELVNGPAPAGGKTLAVKKARMEGLMYFQGMYPEDSVDIDLAPADYLVTVTAFNQEAVKDSDELIEGFEDFTDWDDPRMSKIERIVISFESTD